MFPSSFVFYASIVVDYVNIVVDYVDKKQHKMEHQKQLIYNIPGYKRAGQTSPHMEHA